MTNYALERLSARKYHHLNSRKILCRNRPTLAGMSNKGARSNLQTNA
jgi:hypothetical protein